MVTSAAAPIVIGWSDPVPWRVFIPAVDQCLFTAHRLLSIHFTSEALENCSGDERVLRMSKKNFMDKSFVKD